MFGQYWMFSCKDIRRLLFGGGKSQIPLNVKLHQQPMKVLSLIVLELGVA